MNSVNVLVNLNAGIGFVDTGNAAPGNHPDLAWTLLGDPAGVSISLVQTGGDGWTFYDRQSHPVNMSDSFGKYEYALYCNGTPACGSGGSDPNFGPLEFRVIFPNITPAWFIPNAAGTVFAADIINGYPNGATGLVRTTGPDGGRETTDVVPEPTTLLLVGGGLVAGLRKRKRVV